ncbi:MAG: hypothetical protein QM683_03800 [Lacrimispora sp.]
MFPINNTGKVLLYNVTASFQGDSIQPADSYVGNIKPGESGNVDVMLTGAAPTTDDGKIKILITYEDENGVVSQPVEKEMTLNVTRKFLRTLETVIWERFQPIRSRQVFQNQGANYTLCCGNFGGRSHRNRFCAEKAQKEKGSRGRGNRQ